MLKNNYSQGNQNNYNTSNDNFDYTLDKLSDIYSPNYKQNDEIKNFKITLQDLGLLSKYENNVLRTVGKLVGIVTSNGSVSYDELISIVNKLGEHKLDIEKAYLMSLFFPEKVKAAANLFPFPVPTYTYVQKIQFFIVPNVKGAFLIQAVCPLLLTTGLSATASNLYANISAALDGSTLLDATTGAPTPLNTRSPPNAFNAYTLQSMKISAKYVGRVDVISGYFGGSFHLSTVNSLAYDYAPTQFNFVDDALNGTLADVSEGVFFIF